MIFLPRRQQQEHNWNNRLLDTPFRQHKNCFLRVTTLVFHLLLIEYYQFLSKKQPYHRTFLLFLEQKEIRLLDLWNQLHLKNRQQHLKLETTL